MEKIDASQKGVKKILLHFSEAPGCGVLSNIYMSWTPSAHPHMASIFTFTVVKWDCLVPGRTETGTDKDEDGSFKNKIQ